LQAHDVGLRRGDSRSLLSQAPDASSDVPGQQFQWLTDAYRHPRESLAANPLQVAQIREVRGPHDTVVGLIGQADRVAMSV
jgi:hypothetical protein